MPIEVLRRPASGFCAVVTLLASAWEARPYVDHPIEEGMDQAFASEAEACSHFSRQIFITCSFLIVALAFVEWSDRCVDHCLGHCLVVRLLDDFFSVRASLLLPQAAGPLRRQARSGLQEGVRRQWSPAAAGDGQSVLSVHRTPWCWPGLGGHEGTKARGHEGWTGGRARVAPENHSSVFRECITY